MSFASRPYHIDLSAEESPHFWEVQNPTVTATLPLQDHRRRTDPVTGMVPDLKERRKSRANDAAVITVT